MSDPNQRAAQAFQPGAMVADKYLIEHSLAEGAMGRVYVATQEPIGRQVALKILKPILANDDELQERFLREAVAVSKLHHPGVFRHSPTRPRWSPLSCHRRIPRLCT